MGAAKGSKGGGGRRYFSKLHKRSSVANATRPRGGASGADAGSKSGGGLPWRVGRHQGFHSFKRSPPLAATVGVGAAKAERQVRAGWHIATFDGACRGNPGPTGQGSVLFGADGEPLRERLGNIGRQTNNVSEYVAFQNALELALEECGEGGQVLVLGDSKLVLNQVTGVWQVSKPHLLPYRDRCQRLLKRFRTVAVSHVRREFNSHADAVANEALDAGESSAIDRDATVSTRLRLPPDVEADFRALQQGA